MIYVHNFLSCWPIFLMIGGAYLFLVALRAAEAARFPKRQIRPWRVWEGM